MLEFITNDKQYPFFFTALHNILIGISMKNRSKILFLITTLMIALLLFGCGGGGGGEDGNNSVTNPPINQTPNNPTPPINNDLAIGDFSGTVTFPSQQNSNSKLSKALSKIHFALSSIRLTETNNLALANVNVDFFVTVDKKDGTGIQPYFKIGNASTNSNGNYQVSFLKSSFDSLKLQLATLKKDKITSASNAWKGSALNLGNQSSVDDVTTLINQMVTALHGLVNSSQTINLLTLSPWTELQPRLKVIQNNQATTLEQSILVDLESFDKDFPPLNNDIDSLYTSSAYKMQIVLSRPSINGTQSINTKVSFQPSYNGKVLGDAKTSSKNRLSVNVQIDFSSNQAIRLELSNPNEYSYTNNGKIISWKENIDSLLEPIKTKVQNQQVLTSDEQSKFDLYSKLASNPNLMKERLIVQQNVDTNGDGLQNETEPLVVISKPEVITTNGINIEPKIQLDTTTNKASVITIYEVDADANGQFAEGNDLVAPSALGNNTSDNTKIASFVDIDGTSTPSSQETVQQQDQELPHIFFQPLPNNNIVQDSLNLIVNFSDNLAYNLSTLKIFSADEEIAFPPPLNKTIKKAVNFSDLFQRDTTIDGGTAKYTFTRPVTSFPNGLSHTLKASIEDFAGNKAIAVLTFKINREPRIIAPTQFIISEAADGITTSISFTVEDIPPISISMRSFSGLKIPLSINLSIQAKQCIPQNSQQIECTESEVASKTSSNIQAIRNLDNTRLEIKGIYPSSTNATMNPLITVTPGHNFSLELGGPRPFELTAKDSNNNLAESKIITLTPNKDNTIPSSSSKICWSQGHLKNTNGFLTNDLTALTEICTKVSDTAPTGCDANYTASSTQSPCYCSDSFQVAENTTSTFVFCSSDLDFENEVSLNFISIQKTQGDTSPKEIKNTDIYPFHAPKNVSFRYYPDSNSVLPAIIPTLSSISIFDWKPDPLQYGGTNKLNFTYSDGVGALQSIQLTLSVSTVEDAPLLTRLNGNLSASSGDILTLPLSIDQSLLENYLNGLNKTPLFKVKQGNSIQLSFHSTDDERQLINGTVPYLNLLNSSGFGVNVANWLQQPNNGNLDVSILNLAGKSSNSEALIVTQYIIIETADSIALPTTYTIPFEIIDQNDPPIISSLNNDLTQASILVMSNQASQIVTLVYPLAVLEDTTIDLYIHAQDNDPSKNADGITTGICYSTSFNFQDNTNYNETQTRLNNLGQSVNNQIWTQHLKFSPTTIDTKEIQGNSTITENLFILKVISGNTLQCKQTETIVHLKVNVTPVDEAPFFTNITLNNGVDIDSGSLKPNNIFTIYQGQAFAFKQFLIDEELHLISDVVLSNPNPQLSFNLSFFPNNNGSKPSFFTLSSTLSNNDIPDYINGLPQVLNLEYTVVNSILASGLTTTRSESLSFRLSDTADAPSFINTNTGIIFTDQPTTINMTEGVFGSFLIRTTNDNEKNPKFKNNFSFKLFSAPAGVSLSSSAIANAPILGSASAQPGVTAIIKWTPTQNDVDGVNSKTHDIAIQSCISQSLEAPTSKTCTIQNFRVQVSPVDDLADIYFNVNSDGTGGTLLTSNTFSVNNPFTISEDSDFINRFLAIDVDGEDVTSLKVDLLYQGDTYTANGYSLAKNSNTNFTRSSSLTSISVSNIKPLTQLLDGEELFLPNSTPVSNPLSLSILQEVFWKSIDWDDISTSPQSLSITTYVIRLQAISNGKTKEVSMYLKLISTNDSPKITNQKFAQEIGQKDLAGKRVQDLAQLVYNEEGDNLTYNINTPDTFLSNQIESSGNSQYLTLSISPGFNEVGPHTLTLSVNETTNTQNNDSQSISFVVTDSNDPLNFSNESIFNTIKILSERETWTTTIKIIDRDLRSTPFINAPLGERVTYQVIGSLSTSYTDSSTKLFYSTNSMLSLTDTNYATPTLSSTGTNHVTSGNIIFFGTNIPRQPLSPIPSIIDETALLNFSFTALQVTTSDSQINDPFASFDYYLHFLAMDHFRSERSIARQTVHIFIKPIDNQPEVRFLSQQAINPLSSSFPVKFNNAVSLENTSVVIPTDATPLLPYIIKEDSIPFTFSLTAFDQESEAISFSFVQTNLSTSSTSTLTNLTNISVNIFQATSSNSLKMSFTPTNINVGHQNFILELADTESPNPISINKVQKKTAEINLLIANVSDQPFLTHLNYSNLNTKVKTAINISSTSISPIVLYEDQVNHLIISIDDLDLHIPKHFSTKSKLSIQSAYGVTSTTAINNLEQLLMPEEFFRYQLITNNIETFFGLSIFKGSTDSFTLATDVTLYEYSVQSQLAKTSTSNLVSVSWVPDVNYTFDLRLDASKSETIPMTFFVDSFASKSIDISKKTSLTTSIPILVWPRNDTPTLTSEKLEYDFNEDEAGIILFTLNDEEEANNLSLHFAANTTQPSGLEIVGKQIQWTPDNNHTILNSYNISLIASDTGKITPTTISDPRLQSTTALHSKTYTITIQLKDKDDSSQQDTTYIPAITAVEDAAYKSYIRYTDIDPGDRLEYSLISAPTGMQITTSPTEHDDIGNTDLVGIITWTPNLPGQFAVKIGITSIVKSTGLIKETLEYNYNIQVSSVNDKPRFLSPAPSNIVENEFFKYTPQVADEDNETIFLSFDSTFPCTLPGFMELEANSLELTGFTTLGGLETIENSFGDSNEVPTTAPVISGGINYFPKFHICLTLSDGANPLVTQTFDLTMTRKNNTPSVIGLKILTNPSSVLSSQRTTQTTLDLLRDSNNQPGVYTNPTGRLVKLYQKEGFVNRLQLTIFDEELDGPLLVSAESIPTGVSIVNPTPSLNASGVTTVELTWLADPSVANTQQTFVLRLKDSKGAFQDFTFIADVSDEPDKPVIQTAILASDKFFATEDILNTQVQLFSIDSDSFSLVTYSIVTSEASIPHPTSIIQSSHPEFNNSYSLNLNNDGAVQFLATTAIISNDKLVPVTFSICGSPRVSSFSSDCITVRYNYRLIYVNDNPVFSPTIPPSAKVTGTEGTDYIGLTFRKVLNSSGCMPPESLEICLFDEESTSLSDIANLKLEIIEPEVFPNGLSLSNPILSNGNSYIQTVIWTNIPADEAPARNLIIHGYESLKPAKLVTFTYTIDIANVNNAPLINNGFPLLKETLLEGQTFLYNFSSITNDPDGDPLTYRLLKGVSNMTINTDSGLISWIPNTSHLGLHLIQVSVEDSPFSTKSIQVTTTFFVEVKKVNNPPTISPILRKIFDTSIETSPTATETQSFEAKVFAFDEEGDSFSFIPSLSKLNGQAFNPNFSFSALGKINWVPTNAEVGPNQLQVVAQDTQSGTNTTAFFTLTVINKNDPPSIIDPISKPQIINESDTYTHQFVVSDQDPSETLTFSAFVEPPTIIASISLDGLLTIVTNENSKGNYTVTVSVNDSGNLTDTNTFSLEILNTNNIPTLFGIPELYVEKTKTYIHELDAFDPEGDAITFETEELNSQRAPEVQLEASSGLLNINYNNNPLSFTFAIKAKDSTGQYAASTQAVTVIYTDSVPPRIISSPPKTGKILTEYQYEAITDPASGTEIEAVVLPQGMTVDSNTLYWVPQFNPQQGINQAGTHLVVIRAKQNINGEIIKSKPQKFNLEISAANDAPVANYLTNEVTGEEKINFAAVEANPFINTILKITDINTEDFSRVHACFDIGVLEACTANSGTKQAVSNSSSTAVASLGVTTKVVQNNQVELLVSLNWNPDNAAAEGENSFHIYATDGIDRSNVLTVTFNVSNTNNSPAFFQDENLVVSETAFMGSPYKRTFFARDEDKETTWFCLDKEKFTKDAEPNFESSAWYPGFAPKVLIPYSAQDQSKVRVRLIGEDDIFYTKEEIVSLPDSQYCVKGLPIILANDPHPERGKLSKIIFEYYPLNRHFLFSQRPSLPLELSENKSIKNENITPTFLLQLAPTINALMPEAQFEEGLVFVTGEGVLNQGSLPLTVKFQNSQKVVIATTTVTNLGVTEGFGQFIVPKGAESGFISIGFSVFSSSVPFTVLKGESSVIAGTTETDEANFSASAGLAVTWVDSQLYAFVSNAEYHTINLYKFDNTGNKKDFYINQQFQPSLQISGQLGKSGDSNLLPNLLNFPTGLSIAYNKTTTYLLVADTNNNKIKAIDLSDLWSSKKETNYSFNHYTIAQSTHLNRPYKAIQKSPNSTNIFIANTFNNTVELLNVGSRDFKVLENFQRETGIDNQVGSQNTSTSTGTGYARVDTFGNLFHPIDLAFNDDQSTLWVSSYTNHSYSLNSSFHLYTGKWIDKNDFSGTGQSYVETNIFYNKNISLSNLAEESLIEGNQQNLITLSNSNVKTQITTEGLTYSVRSEDIVSTFDPNINNPKITNQVSYLIVNEKGLYNNPYELWNKEMIEFNNYHTPTTPNTALTSNNNMSYQTQELHFKSSIAKSGAIKGSAQAKASILLRPKTRELIISPKHDVRNTYALTFLEKSELPSFLTNKKLGDPFYYDTTQDQVPDLFLPVPLDGIVYIFKGIANTLPSLPPLTFDFSKYWYINSISMGPSCADQECMVGVRHINTARFLGHNLPKVGSLESTRGTLRGDDLIFVNSVKSTIYIVDSYGFSVNQISVGTGGLSTHNSEPITGMADFNFHINQKAHADWNATTPFNVFFDSANPSSTYWTQPSASPGTPVTFFATDSPYSGAVFTMENSPYRVVAGHYTSKYLSQTCYSSTCLIDEHCSNDTQCNAPDGILGDTPDNISYGWTIDRDSGFTSFSVDLLNLEQLAVIDTPSTQTNDSVITFIGLDAESEYTISLGNDKAFSKVYSGMIDSAPTHSVVAMTWNSNSGGIAFGSQSFSQNQRARQDGVIFFDKNAKLVYKIIQDSNFQATQVVQNVYSLVTDLSKCGKVSDFRIIDIDGDQISDLIALHIDTNQVSIHRGTGNRSEAQFFTGALTCDDIGTDVQVLPTLDKPHSIDILDTTRLSQDSFSNVEFVISYEESQSISVFTTSKIDGEFFKLPVHFNMGLSNLKSIKTINRTNKIHNLVDTSTLIPTDFSLNVADQTTQGINIWNGFYFGVPNTNDPFYIEGVKESIIATAGIVFTQSIPTQSQANIGAMTLVKEWIFKSTRSYFVSTESLDFFNTQINKDNQNDIVVMDPYNHLFTVFLSEPSVDAILYDPNAKSYNTEGLIGGMAFGDINEDIKDDISFKAHNDIIVSNFSNDTITIYHNGGQSSNSAVNPDYTFSHSSYPPTTISVGNGPTGVTMADFDNNGYQDIAVSNYVGGNITILFNQGTNPITFKSILLPAGLAPKQIYAVDLDVSIGQTPKNTDIVVINRDSNDIYVYKNNGKGQFSTPYIYAISDYFPSNHSIKNLDTGLLIDPNEEKSQDFLYGNVGSQKLSSLTTFNNFLIGKTYGISSFINTGDKSSSQYHSGISSYSVNLDGSLSFQSLKQTNALTVIKSLAFMNNELYFGSTELSPSLSNPFVSTNGSYFTTASIHRWDLSSLLSAAPQTAVTISDTSFFNLRKDQLGGVIEAMATTKKPGSSIKELYYIHSGKSKTLQRLLPTSQELISGTKKSPVATNIITEFGENFSFNHPAGLILDPTKNTLLVADSQSNLIRIIDLESNVTRTLVIGSQDNFTYLTGVIDITQEYNTFNYFTLFPNATLNTSLGLIRPSDDPDPSFSFITLNDKETSITPSNWFQLMRYQQYLYIAENSDLINPSNGNIYEVDTSQSPFTIHKLSYLNSYNLQGLSGMTLSKDGQKIFISEYQSNTIKTIDLVRDINTGSLSNLTITTIAGFDQISGHFDGSTELALLSRPRALVLNDNEDSLFFIDGSSIRYINLENFTLGLPLEVNTIAGNPFQTGIINGAGTRSRFLTPYYMQYKNIDGKDVLYISDYLANNIREFRP